jgi:GntR family transcriptional regulator, transcriptional repressor for pyruvate dehydrogenase complex
LDQLLSWRSVPLQRIQKRSLPDSVFEQLTAAIVGGAYEPGAALPSERELSETLGVNRHVVREAVKRAEQIGLVKVAQGGRTKVLDFRQTAGLDLLAVLAEHSDALDAALPLLRAALEMRAGIGADLARLCARRADGDVRGDLIELAEELARVRVGVELLELDERFWQRVLDGAGNLAYQLAFNSLIRTVHAHVQFSVPWIEAELARGDCRRPIAAAIAAADEERSSVAAREALTPPKGFERALTGVNSRAGSR